MFYRLTKKDYITSKNAILLNLAVLLIFSGVMFKIAQLDFLLFIFIIYIVLIVIVPITVEDKLKTGGLIASLPVKRSKIVYGRYVSAAIIIPALVLIIFSYGLAVERFMTMNYIDFSGSMSFSLVFSVIFFAVIAVSFFIPFIYRFGQMGIVIGMSVTMVLTTLLFIITSIGIRGDIIRNTIGVFFEKQISDGIISSRKY